MGNQTYNGNYGQNHQPPPPPQDYGQPHQAPPPPPPHNQPPPPQFYGPQPKPKKMPAAVIVTIVIVVVVVVIIAAAFLFLGNKQGSPEKVLKAFYGEMSDGDINGAMDLTDAHFMSPSDYNDMIDYMEDEDDWDEIDAGLHDFEVLSIDDIEYKSDMSSDERDDWEWYIDAFEDEFNFRITNYADIEYTMTETYLGDIDTDDEQYMEVIEVDGKWYLAMFAYYWDSYYWGDWNS